MAQERDRLARERELMLRNAKPLASSEPYYGQIRLKVETTDSFPKET